MNPAHRRAAPAIPTAPPRINTAQAVGAFLASRDNAGCSPATLAWYRYMLAPLARQHRFLPYSAFDIEALLGRLQEAGLRPASRLSHWRALRVFYAWAQRRLGAANPMLEADRPRLRRQLPKALSRDQVQKLLRTNRHRPRTYAMLMLAIDTGARVGEIAGITQRDVLIAGVGDVDVRISGKTGDRLIPIQPETYRALRAIMRPGHDRLWTSKNALQLDARRAFARAGLRGSMHTLRHTFGLLYIQAGGDVFSLQELMGHSNIATTRIYLNMSRRQVKDQHAKFSPIRQLFTVLEGGKAQPAAR